MLLRFLIRRFVHFAGLWLFYVRRVSNCNFSAAFLIFLNHFSTQYEHGDTPLENEGDDDEYQLPDVDEKQQDNNNYDHLDTGDSDKDSLRANDFRK